MHASSSFAKHELAHLQHVQKSGYTMSTTPDKAQFYQNDEYSDITLSYSGNHFPGHRIILCTQSDVFKAMFGSGAKMKEKNQAIVELHDDDPEALEAVLRWLYTETYQEGLEKTRDWQFHLSVAETADKYLCNALEALASGNLRTIVARITDIKEVMRVMEVLPTSAHRVQSTQEILQDLREKHFHKLMKQPQFRDSLKRDNEKMMEDIERLTTMQKLKKRKLYQCRACGKEKVMQATAEAVCPYCHETPAYATITACWMEDS